MIIPSLKEAAHQIRVAVELISEELGDLEAELDRHAFTFDAEALLNMFDAIGQLGTIGKRLDQTREEIADITDSIM